MIIYFKTSFMKYLKYFLLVILQFAIVELVVWFHTTGLGWHISELTPSDAISLWGTVTTIVFLAYIIHSGFISGYQNRYGDNLKPPTNVYHRMTA